ncbi:MAG TPA: hypothetical protein VFH95_05760 [Candidatus Kapabacteria bacterium]|nr:hypothetical protein [Candidatus Kapabacteria bacterium]
MRTSKAERYACPMVSVVHRRGNQTFSPLIAIIMLAILLGIPSCGTIINGSREEVAIMAQPGDATITVDSIYHNTGFFRGELDRKSSHQIVISKEGYITTRIQTGNSVSGWFFGNFYTFSLYGMIPDLITGGAYTISPNPILVQLTPGTGPPITEVHNLDGYLEAGIPTAIVVAIEIWLIVAIARGGI